MDPRWAALSVLEEIDNLGADSQVHLNLFRRFWLDRYRRRLSRKLQEPQWDPTPDLSRLEKRLSAWGSIVVPIVSLTARIVGS
jgi:hypothetical protein